MSHEMDVETLLHLAWIAFYTIQDWVLLNQINYFTLENFKYDFN